LPLPLRPHRPRNAQATREAILDCARRKFRSEGYDAAGLREIAGCAGVDAALVFRYFGSKEELLLEVLQSSPKPAELFGDGIEGFGERAARLMVDAPADDPRLECLMIVLRSFASQAAADVIRSSSRDHFFGPLVELLGGGPDGEVRATLVAAIMKGVAVARFIDDDLGLSAPQRALFRDRLAETLQQAAQPR
jgi:AcrR family transcriptional regulator